MTDETKRWKKARKRPVWIEYREAVPGETVETREGVLVAQQGDYIIRGVEGEVYPIARHIFAKTYETEEQMMDPTNRPPAAGRYE